MEFQEASNTSVENQLNEIKVQIEKKKLHNDRIEELTKERSQVNEKLLEISSSVVDTQVLLNNYKASIIDLEKTREKVLKTIEDNIETIDTLGNCQTFKTKQKEPKLLQLQKQM